MAAVTLAVGAAMEANSSNSDGGSLSTLSLKLPPQAQVIDAATFVSLPSVPPTSEYNGTTVGVDRLRWRRARFNQCLRSGFLQAKHVRVS
jgi:hypothetical protein